MAILRDVPLRSVSVAEPETALDEAMRLLQSDPLKTVVLLSDETYMGVFNEDALQSNLIPRKVDPATLPVGPYVHPSRAVGHPAMSVEQALTLLIRKGADVLPVVENNTFLGVVTRDDLERLTPAA